MILIPQPSMALNAADVPGAHYRMWNSWVVPGTDSADHIIGWTSRVADTAADRYLRAVILHCHGFYGRDSFGRLVGGFGLKMGRGIRRADTSRFTRLKGKVRAIIITACGAARIAEPRTKFDGDGNLFCQEIAQASGAYVFAGTTQQIGDRYLPFGHIDDWEGLVVGYSPRGEMIFSRDYGRGLIEGLRWGYD